MEGFGFLKIEPRADVWGLFAPRLWAVIRYRERFGGKVQESLLKQDQVENVDLGFSNNEPLAYIWKLRAFKTRQFIWNFRPVDWPTPGLICNLIQYRERLEEKWPRMSSDIWIETRPSRKYWFVGSSKTSHLLMLEDSQHIVLLCFDSF